MKNELTKIQNMIYEIRGQKVMFDRDLAGLYGVELKVMNQAVKRNVERFPPDFMFQLTQDEWDILRSQIVTANENISKVRFSPYVFTEQGVSMLSSVINSKRAIEVNINIMRTFVKLRRYVLLQSDKNEQIIELKKLLMLHIENDSYKFSEYNKTIKQIVYALNNLTQQPKETKRIGFRTGSK